MVTGTALGHSFRQPGPQPAVGRIELYRHISLLVAVRPRCPFRRPGWRDVAKVFRMGYVVEVSAYIQFRIHCNGPDQPADHRCSNAVVVEADNVTTARRYALDDHAYVSIQTGNVVEDFCPDCDPTKLEPDLYLRLRTGRSTHRLARNGPADERERARRERDEAKETAGTP